MALSWLLLDLVEVLDNVQEGWAPLRLKKKAVVDHVSQLFTALTWGFELVSEIPNHTCDLGLRPPPVRNLACDHLVKDDAETEHVTRHGVRLVPQNLRGTPIELLLVQFLVILSLVVLIGLCLLVSGLRHVL